ncbi:MAG TPA: AI-2E family transporter [Vicinamibacterales bacterium]|jgi:predicted PurR-regulated permease PerM
MPSTESAFYPRVFASVTAVVLGVAMLWMLQPLVGPLLWAGLLAFLLNPAAERMSAAFKGRRSLAALLLTLAVVVTVVVPLIFVVTMFVMQTSELVGRLQSSAAQYQIQSPSDVLALPAVDAVVKRIGNLVPISAQQVRDAAIKGGQDLLQALISLGGSLFASIFGAVVAVILALFLFFFFVRDGHLMIERAMVLVPLDERRKADLLAHLSSVLRAIVLGSLVTAMVQGSLVGIGFAIVGLPSPIVFAVLAMGASLIPFIGTTLVWVPAALWLVLTGHWGMGVFLVVWGVAVVSSADNVVRPLFISTRAKISTLPVFIGLIGGISAFGAIGAFLGPVLIALVLALLDFAAEARREVPPPEAQTP